LSAVFVDGKKQVYVYLQPFLYDRREVK